MVSALDWGSRGRRFKSGQPDHHISPGQRLRGRLPRPVLGSADRQSDGQTHESGRRCRQRPSGICLREDAQRCRTARSSPCRRHATWRSSVTPWPRSSSGQQGGRPTFLRRCGPHRLGQLPERSREALWRRCWPVGRVGGGPGTSPGGGQASSTRAPGLAVTGPTSRRRTSGTQPSG